MQKFKKIISIVILLVLIPILFMSMVILINSYTHPNKIPSFFGWKPFIVLSGSMETQISVGDVVVVKEVDTNTLKKGDIIAFNENNIVITHRINEVIYEDGKTKYITKGDNNNTQDSGYVTPEQVEGVFQFKISRLGNLAMFVQLNDNKKDKELIDEKMSKQKEMEKEIEKLKKQNEELKKK